MTAWILGGSSGLGKELSAAAEQHGINSVALGRSAEFRVDLSDRQSVQALCQSIANLDDETARSVSFFIWNAGALEYRPISEMEHLEQVFAVNIHSPTEILRSFVRRKKALGSLFHLITISSIASWKARADMAVYAGVKAYQAQFSRCLALELERDLPGSKVTIALPAGMKTGLFPPEVNTSEFMEPSEVASLIWREALAQKKSCDWFNLLRVGGRPVVSREHFAPELAYDELPRYNRGSS